MALQQLKNRLKNWLFIVLSLGGFLAVYFLAFYFFSHQGGNNNYNPDNVAIGSSSMIAEIADTFSENIDSLEQNIRLNEQQPIIESFPAPVATAPTSNSTSSSSSSSSSSDKNAFSIKAILPTAITTFFGSDFGSEPDLLPNISDSSLVFGSFFNTFSGSIGIDLKKTTLYQDENTMAILYPPDYSWQSATSEIVNLSQKDFDSFNFNDFRGPYYDRRCLAADCLEQKENELFFNGRLLPLPADIKKSEIAAVSIGVLNKNWLVGFTLKDGQNYEGKIFYFDGQKFKLLATPAPIRSSYFGLFGFGGDESDFLVIYGAYEGIAYHIQPEKIIDISKFFNIRVMNNGFKPEIIRTAYENNVNWYVFSSTLFRPRFIKLWQNRTSEIVGGTVFTNLFAPADESVLFKLVAVKTDEIIFLTRVRNNNSDSWETFTDRGFKNNSSGSLIFNSVSHNKKNSSIIIKRIAASRLDLDAGSRAAVKFLFSANGNNWQEIPAGQNLNFITPALESFLLQVVFPASLDKFYSPFLEAVLFDYYCQK
jgi:hypothetical protein